MAGVHVGAHGLVAEWIDQFVPLQKRPAAAGGKLGGVHPAPRRLGRLQAGVGLHNRLDQFAREERAVAGIDPAAEAVVHRTGRAMAVRGGNEDAIERDSSFVGGQALGLVAQVARQHATVDHHDGQARHAVVKHETARVQRVDNFAVARLNEAAVSNHRQRLRRDVHLGRAGTQLCSHFGGKQASGQQQGKKKKVFLHFSLNWR